jgi:hypothetical protein
MEAKKGEKKTQGSLPEGDRVVIPVSSDLTCLFGQINNEWTMKDQNGGW